MRIARRIVLLATASILTAACSLLTSVDGLSGGDADGGAAARSDAGDASTTETSTPLGDGGDGGDAGPWCATHRGDASICEDFDTDGLADWESVAQGVGGTTRPDPAAATSPPFAMLSDLPAASSGRPAGYVARKVPMPAADIALDADFRVEKTNTAASQLQVAKLLQLGAVDEGIWELGLAVTDKRKLVVFQYNYSTNGYAEVFVYPTAVALGAWTRVRLHLRVQNVLDGLVDVDVDGVRVASALPVQPLSARSRFSLFLGAIYTDTPNTGWSLRTDNVLLDAK